MRRLHSAAHTTAATTTAHTATAAAGHTATTASPNTNYTACCSSASAHNNLQYISKFRKYKTPNCDSA
jgi:hypothetical protein